MHSRSFAGLRRGLLLLNATPASAAYPERMLTMVVRRRRRHDVLARIVGQKMGELLGQTVVW